MDSERKRKLLLLLALILKKEKRWAVRPIFQNRLQQGDGYHLYEEMRMNDAESFFNFFRMTPAQFDFLLGLVGPKITKQNTNFKESIPPKQRLAVTLRYLASGDLMASISYSFRIGRSTISNIILETCEAIREGLSPLVLAKPTKESWLRVADDYFSMWQFPNCVGAIDGKHVLIQAPMNSGSRYHNYKGSFSIILMAVVDAEYKFLVVAAGAEGHNSDGGVFRNSQFGRALNNGQLDLPPPSPAPVSGKVLPFCFVGDEAFPLKTNLMRPYPGTQPHNNRVFNYRLSRARRCVENAFGVMAARFRIFRRPIQAKTATCINIVSASVCLHNYLMCDRQRGDNKYCPTGYADVDSNGEVTEGQWREEESSAIGDMGKLGSNSYSKKVEEIRKSFVQYVNIDACLAWQDSQVTAAN